uniref:Ninjurin 1 n=1 Tax=Cyprinus carpio TaxID=7962 RepID=A0A8C2A0Y6_CYPCA
SNNRENTVAQRIVRREGNTHCPFNLNHYATKKSAAQSMLDVALLMVNSSQLKTVLHSGAQHRFYAPLIALISLSISLQVTVGLLIFIVKYDLNDVRIQPRLNTMNDTATVFCVLYFKNVFLPSFELYRCVFMNTFTLIKHKYHSKCVI